MNCQALGVGDSPHFPDPDGHNISFSYDADNRLTTKTLPEGAINYSYDAVGNMTSIQSYNGSSIQTTYDAMNRPSQVVQKLPSGYSATISYSYDLDGNKTGMTTPWGTFSFTYDADNRETSITNPQGKKFAFTYDADGHRIGLAYPNGVQTSYGYDAASQLTQIIHQKNGTALAFANYNYDSDGNRILMQTTDGTNSYGYDALSRLISASHPAATDLPTLNESFAYDPVGNRLADAAIANYSYNAANELVSNSSFTYSYDNNGNLISKTTVGGSATSYNYDSENELISVSSSGAQIQTNQYDPLGRRIYRSTGTLPSQTYQYVYDNQDILAMLDGSGNLIAVFTHGPGIDEPLEIRQANGTEYFLHADGLGSIVAATDINGAVVERIEYESYGQPVFLDERGASPVVEAQSFTGSPYAFTGRPFDVETGLYDLRNRIYDPITGHFIQVDPIMFAADPVELNFLAQSQGKNLHSMPLPFIGRNEFYAYTADNPINRIDPLGLLYLDIGAVGTAAGLWGPGFNAGFQFGLGGIYWYLGFGLAPTTGAGWAFSGTLNLGSPEPGVAITNIGTLTLLPPLAVQVGATCPFNTGHFSGVGGIGIALGGGASSTVTQTILLTTWSNLLNKFGF